MTLASEGRAVANAPLQSRNHLLAALPPTDFHELRPHLTTTLLPAKARLAEPHRAIDAVYFPLDAVIAMAATDRKGEEVEVGSIGCEGMVGLAVFFCAARSTSRVLVQIAGDAERMDAAVLEREAGSRPALQRLLRLYAQAFMTQVAQSTACNRLHTAEARLARWLLICRDRIGRDDIPMTHETMAVMLGVRRATVTEAAGTLQRRGLIRYRRGMLSIVDRPQLEGASCECYAIVREEFDRLLGVRVG